MVGGFHASAVARAAVGVAVTVACDGSPALSPAGVDTTTGAYAIRLLPATVHLMAPPGAPSSTTVRMVVLKLSDTTALPNAQVTWSIDALSIATVTTAGMVTAVAPGTTLLHARYSGVDITAPVAVAPIPAANTFVRTGSMSRARIGHTATLLPNGKVLIAGGSSSETAELYDPTTGTFAPTGSMSVARSHHSATLLPDGRVLIAGGGAATAELYNPATGTFSRTGDMLQAQSWQTGTLLTNGKVLLSGGVGGSTDCCAVVPTPELYDPTTGTFSATGAYVPNSGLASDVQTWGLTTSTATLLRDGRVLVAAEPVAQLYDPAAGTFALTGQMKTGWNGLLPMYIVGRTATLLDDGRVFLAGGEHEDLGRFTSTELYDPATGAFVAGASMAIVRDGHTATLLASGKVLIAGGESQTVCSVPSTCAVVSTTSAELYDPVSNEMALVGSMNERREWHEATLLEDGRVLITGGLTFIGGPANFGSVSATALASAELYVGSSPVSTRAMNRSRVAQAQVRILEARHVSRGLP